VARDRRQRHAPAPFGDDVEHRGEVALDARDIEATTLDQRPAVEDGAGRDAQGLPRPLGGEKRGVERRERCAMGTSPPSPARSTRRD
jgi:hypothetical protein